MRIIAPYEALPFPLEDPDDYPLHPRGFLFHADAAPAMVSPRMLFPDQLYEHAVFVKGILHIPCRNKYVRLMASPVVGDQKTVAIPMTAEDAGYQIFAGGKGIPSPLDAMNHAF